MKRVLCIWLPSWPLQRLVAVQPELRDRAVILHAPRPRGGVEVVACSWAAYQLGVRTGMSLAEATALEPCAADRSSSQVDAPAHLVAHDARADWKAIERLAQGCERFSPLVGFEYPCGRRDSRGISREEQLPAPDCLYLDVTGVASHFGGESSLARRVAEWLDQRGYWVRVALSDTIGAAWALTHFIHPQLPPRELAGERGPAGPAQRGSRGSWFLVVPPSHASVALGPLPVRALRLPAPTADCLEQLGILRIEQLMGLPRASLRSRFGDLLLHRLDQATGSAAEMLKVHDPDPLFTAEWVLDHPTHRRTTIEAILEQLLERVTRSLTPRGAGIMQLVCWFECARPETIGDDVADRGVDGTARGEGEGDRVRRLCLDLFQPTDSVRHVTDLVLLRLQGEGLPGPVERVAVEASITAPIERRQRELFADGAWRATDPLARLVDRLSGRLGDGRVVRPQLRADAQPERAYRYVPARGGRRGGGAAGRGRTEGTEGTEACRTVRPLYLYRPPRVLEVETFTADGPPTRMHYQQRGYPIARFWGPERIETGWWRGRSVRRDYYRVETECGHWFWIFRQCPEGRWWLHGMFG